MEGELVWRLFGPLIRHYRDTFELAEKRWRLCLTRNSYFEADYGFVCTLPTQDLRIAFWLDKIHYLSEERPIAASPALLSWWHMDPIEYQECEAELLALLRRLSNHPKYYHTIPLISCAMESSYPFSLL